MYADGETPIIEFADFARISLGPHGMLFEYGQNQPFEDKIVLTHQVIVPHDVAVRMHEILGDQLNEFNETVKKSIEDMKNQGS